MKRTLCRLSPATFVEPLVNAWPAWPTLIAPVPASLHLQRYQLPLLRSFVDHPDLHADAAQSPDLVCGPYAAVPPARAAEIAALIQRTEQTMAPQLRLARELESFQRTLAAEARGLGLEPFYARVPTDLRGRVELVYDYCHHPSVRVIEPLAYRSPLYDSTLQSWRLGRLEHDRTRPYFLNTPRLGGEGEYEWHVPFADARVDELFRLDVAPRPEHEVRDILCVAGDVPLDGLLTCDAGVQVTSWRESRIRVRYFGHACVLVERAGQSVLVDPFVSAVPDRGAARFSFADLPPVIDYVLVTHAHQDHFCLETLLRLRHRTGCLVVPRAAATLYGDVSLRLLAEMLGFRRVVELDVFESLPLADGAITGVPFLGEHADIGHSKVAYVIRSGGRRLLFAADSDCLDPDLYGHVRREMGRIDTVFIGMESEGAILSFAYGSLLPRKPTREQEESRRQHGCNAVRALQLCEAVGASEVYHYAMGLEPWLYPVLGLSLDAGSPQWRESETMLHELHGRGVAARRLEGSTEFVLDESPRPAVTAAAAAPSESPDFQFG